MNVKAAIATVNGMKLAVVLVDEIPPEREALDLLRNLTPYFPPMGIMLVTVGDNGFRAFATFQTQAILALLQLQQLAFLPLDAPLPSDPALPF
jgi:hypothetical protein